VVAVCIDARVPAVRVNEVMAAAMAPWLRHGSMQSHSRVEPRMRRTRCGARGVTGVLMPQGCCVCLAAVLYVWALLQRVSHRRYMLFSCFLMVPAGFLRSLASKQVKVDEEDESDSDSDDGIPADEAKATKQQPVCRLGLAASALSVRSSTAGLPHPQLLPTTNYTTKSPTADVLARDTSHTVSICVAAAAQ
jgi:hypothetical protein